MCCQQGQDVFACGTAGILFFVFGTVGTVATAAMADQDEVAPASVACLPVLTGGYLKRPVVPESKIVDGVPYVFLGKSNKAVTHFVTGQRPGTSPLSRSTVFAKLTEARNRATRAASIEDSDDEEEAKVAALGLDSAPSPRRKRKQPCRDKPLPPVLAVSFRTASGLVKEVNFLPGLGVSKLYMEFTAANMQMVFDEVQAEASFEASGGEEGGPTEVAAEKKRTRADEEPKGNLAWLSKRRTWDLRWTDREGKKRCKTFAVSQDLSPDEVDVAREEARQRAIRFYAANHVPAS